MRILVVEDDDYKKRDIAIVLRNQWPNAAMYSSASVSEACRDLLSAKYDLLILDMSLPTFDILQSGGGTPQSQGGWRYLGL